MPIFDNIPWTFDLDGFLASIGEDPGDDIVEAARRFADEMVPRLRPKAAYAEFALTALGADDSVTVSDVTFNSTVLHQNLERVDRVFPYLVTCGAELEHVDLTNHDYLAFFWVDEIKQMALCEASTWFHRQLRKESGLSKIASMNPGSGNADLWPLRQQQQLFQLLGELPTAIGVSLTPSYLMVPNKTVSGIMFASDSNYVNCRLCSRENCPNRRAPYSATAAIGH